MVWLGANGGWFWVEGIDFCPEFALENVELGIHLDDCGIFVLNCLNCFQIFVENIGSEVSEGLYSGFDLLRLILLFLVVFLIGDDVHFWSFFFLDFFHIPGSSPAAVILAVLLISFD